MLDSPLQQLVCRMGQPVAGNPTQFMMQRAFAAAGLDWLYLTFEVCPENLSDAVRGMRAMEFQGANFTIPHKIAVIEHLDRLSETAALMGAVNCVYREDGQLVGDNTDGQAFVESLRNVTDPAGKKVVLLGAGGAARAIGVELGRAGVAELTIINRTPETGQTLVDLLIDHVHLSARLIPWKGQLAVPDGTDILVNATPIGLLDPDAPVPLDMKSVRPPMVVTDVILNPPDTWLLRQAAQRGCTTLNGLGMLVQQGVIAFRRWTGQDADPIVMREAVEEYLEI